MLNFIEPFIIRDNPKIFPKWRQYIDFHTIQISQLRKRYLNISMGYESRAVQFIRNILSFLDLEWLMKFKGDFDKYMKYLRFIQNDLYSIISPTPYIRHKNGYFVYKNDYATDEYIIPVSSENLFMDYPFDERWNKWKDVKSIRIIDHNSSELNLFLTNQQLRFFRHQPTTVTLTIDPIALCLQYANYLLYCQDEEKGQRQFIHRYVFNNFFEDILDIWIIKQLNFIFDVTNEKELKVDLSKFDIHYGKYGSRYIEALTSLYKDIVENMRKNNVSPNSVIHSYVLSNSRLIDRIHLLTNTLDVHTFKQNKFSEFLRDKSLFNLILKMYSNYPKFLENKTIINKLDIQYKRLIDTKIWNHISDSIMRDIVELEIKNLHKSILMS